MTDYTNLIVRLEAGEAGLTLDADIAEQVLGWEIHWRSDDANQSFPYGIWGDKRKGELGRVPAFTESLDAAVSLVPEGAQYCLGCLSDTRVPIRGVSRYHAWVGSQDTVYAPTPALALCIAALKAREV